MPNQGEKHLEPVEIFSLVQSLSQSISTLNVSAHVKRNNTTKLHQVPQVVNGPVEVFSTSRHTNIILGTDLPVVGLVNVRVAFGKLWPDVEQLQRDAGVFGYKRWFQLQLGENIIRHGIDWCKEQPDETFLSAFLDDEVDEEEDGPHFMPRRLRRVGPSTPAARVPKRCSVEHELVNTYLHPIPQYEGKKRVDDWTRKRACAMCEVRSRREGGGTVQEGGEGQRKRRADPESGARVKQTWWACNRCKVNLCCEACFDQWDHERGRPPCSSATVD